MKLLVEMIGKRNGYSDTDIYNQYERISRNVERLVNAEINLPTDEIIILSIEYSLSFRLQREYENILNYVEEKLI